MRSMNIPWLQLLGVILVSVALAACGGNTRQGGQAATSAPASAGQPAGSTSGSSSSINVVAKDFAFALDAAQLRAGTHTFVVTNEGLAEHDFTLSGNGVEQKTALLGAGETGSFTVDLRPGTYTFLCSLPGHDQLGMQGSLTVSE